MLELPTNIHQAPPTDAVAVEQNKRNYLFFVDAQYIKYYEGPEGGKEGPSVSYKIKTLKLNGKPIKVSAKVQQIAAVAYVADNKKEVSRSVTVAGALQKVADRKIQIRVYYAEDIENLTHLKEVCITNGDFAKTYPGALNDLNEDASSALAPGTSISAINLLSSSLLKVFAAKASGNGELAVWYWAYGDEAWNSRLVKVEKD